MRLPIVIAAGLFCSVPLLRAATVTFLPRPVSEIIPGRGGSPPTVLAPRAEDFLNIDMDGDGKPELANLITTDNAASVGFRFGVIGGPDSNPLNTFPFEKDLWVSGLVAGAIFGSLQELFESGFTTASLEIPSYTIRFPTSGGHDMGLSRWHPILATWMLGTSGAGDSPVSLIGCIVDYSSHFGSGGVEPVSIYYHDYGRFSPGTSLPEFNLAATGIPEPSSLALLLSASLRILRRSRAISCRGAETRAILW